MRITFLLPGIGVTGGIRSTFELANRLTRKGHKVTIVYPLIPLRNGHCWYNFKRQAARLKGTMLGLLNRKQLTWFDLKALLIRVPSLHEHFIPPGDIVVATWWANAYHVAKYGKDKGQKVYFIRHYETWGGPEALVDKTYVLPLYKIVTSTWLKKTIEGRFGVSVSGPVPNGVNFELFHMESNDFKPHNPKRIGMVYRKAKWKGMADGFEAFLEAKERYPSIQLVLFGEQEGDGVPNDVEFHEFPSPNDLRKLYNSLDIFVMPSHHEGFGNPPMEAMACGAASVVTDVGAVRDYTVPGETAFVVPPKQPEKLAEAIIALLGNEHKRQQIAKAGHEYVKQFTWNRSTDGLERIFQDILKGTSAMGGNDLAKRRGPTKVRRLGVLCEANHG
jgi:glycosyltransferase involved in cell wall biosynthesis